MVWVREERGARMEWREKKGRNAIKITTYKHALGIMQAINPKALERDFFESF